MNTVVVTVRPSSSIPGYSHVSCYCERSGGTGDPSSWAGDHLFRHANVVMPLSARQLIHDTALARHPLEVTVNDDSVLGKTFQITAHVNGDIYSAIWFPHGASWRYRYGTDGWTENLTLTSLRSFTTKP